MAANETIYGMASNGSVYFGSKLVDTSDCPETVKFILNSALAGIICCFGIIGNSISFAVLAKDKDAPVAAFLLQTLAIADNFFLSMWFFHFSLSDSFTYFKVHDLFHVTWLYIRVYTYPLLFVGQTSTIYMIILIAVSRYVAVCKPYHAARYSTLPYIQKAAFGVFAFALLYNVPRFFESTIVAVSSNETNFSTIYTLQRTIFGNTRLYGLLYFDTLYYIFSFVLPLILLTYLNTSLTLAYHKVQRRRNTMRSRHENPDHNITLVMIVVILVFILCNAPARIVQIIWGYQPQKCLTKEFFLIEISNILEVLNSSANFIVYCLFRSQFRKILTARFCHGVRPPPDIVINGLPTNGGNPSGIVDHLTVCTGLTSEGQDDMELSKVSLDNHQEQTV